ncbi:transcription elongation factor Elf1 [Granulicella aggregans]|uniref:Transcription elongation factor Elf1 n=1 Tax=Granulicella aggregans TaxID=474949 RepID=A0A7W8E6A6_9BACT|nr:transcription elongation factor Elf1 [Granulicella aggregans]
MPIDYERMLQYKTPLRCPDCGEQTFQTDAVLLSPSNLVEAECTNCGHPLTEEEIASQVSSITLGALKDMLAQ